MLIASVGAGILNGQIAKVGMTVIPPERAGMASGVAGTMRFGGIVVGFAALGAVLFQRIEASINHGLPVSGSSATLAITRAIANGDLSAAAALIRADGGSGALARASVGYGYEGMLCAAALVALIATVLCYLLVNPRETAPERASAVRQFEPAID
jgi:hypothetical protein